MKHRIGGFHPSKFGFLCSSLRGYGTSFLGKKPLPQGRGFFAFQTSTASSCADRCS